MSSAPNRYSPMIKLSKRVGIQVNKSHSTGFLSWLMIGRIQHKLGAANGLGVDSSNAVFMQLYEYENLIELKDQLKAEFKKLATEHLRGSGKWFGENHRLSRDGNGSYDVDGRLCKVAAKNVMVCQQRIRGVLTGYIAVGRLRYSQESGLVTICESPDTRDTNAVALTLEEFEKLCELQDEIEAEFESSD